MQLTLPVPRFSRIAAFSGLFALASASPGFAQDTGTTEDPARTPDRGDPSSAAEGPPEAAAPPDEVAPLKTEAASPDEQRDPAVSGPASTAPPTLEPSAASKADEAYAACMAMTAEQPDTLAPDASEEETADQDVDDTPTAGGSADSKDAVTVCLERVRDEYPGTPGGQQAATVVDAVRVLQLQLRSGGPLSGPPYTSGLDDGADGSELDEDGYSFFRPHSFLGRAALTIDMALLGGIAGAALVAGPSIVGIPLLPNPQTAGATAGAAVLAGGVFAAAGAVGGGTAGFLLSADDIVGSPGGWLGASGSFFGGALGLALTLAVLDPYLFALSNAGRLTGPAATLSASVPTALGIVAVVAGAGTGLFGGQVMAKALALTDRQVNLLNATLTLGVAASALAAYSSFLVTTEVYRSLALGRQGWPVGLLAIPASVFVVGSVSHLALGLGLAHALDFSVAEGILILAGGVAAGALTLVSGSIGLGILVAALQLPAASVFSVGLLPAIPAAGAGAVAAGGVLAFIKHNGGEEILLPDAAAWLKDNGIELDIAPPMVVPEETGALRLMGPTLVGRF